MQPVIARKIILPSNQLDNTPYILDFYNAHSYLQHLGFDFSQEKKDLILCLYANGKSVNAQWAGSIELTFSTETPLEKRYYYGLFELIQTYRGEFESKAQKDTFIEKTGWKTYTDAKKLKKNTLNEVFCNSRAFACYLLGQATLDLYYKNNDLTDDLLLNEAYNYLRIAAHYEHLQAILCLGSITHTSLKNPPLQPHEKIKFLQKASKLGSFHATRLLMELPDTKTQIPKFSNEKLETMPYITKLHEYLQLLNQQKDIPLFFQHPKPACDTFNNYIYFNSTAVNSSQLMHDIDLVCQYLTSLPIQQSNPYFYELIRIISNPNNTQVLPLLIKVIDIYIETAILPTNHTFLIEQLGILLDATQPYLTEKKHADIDNKVALLSRLFAYFKQYYLLPDSQKNKMDKIPDSKIVPLLTQCLKYKQIPDDFIIRMHQLHQLSACKLLKKETLVKSVQERLQETSIAIERSTLEKKEITAELSKVKQLLADSLVKNEAELHKYSALHKQFTELKQQKSSKNQKQTSDNKEIIHLKQELALALKKIETLSIEHPATNTPLVDCETNASLFTAILSTHPEGIRIAAEKLIMEENLTLGTQLLEKCQTNDSIAKLHILWMQKTPGIEIIQAFKSKQLRFDIANTLLPPTHQYSAHACVLSTMLPSLVTGNTACFLYGSTATDLVFHRLYATPLSKNAGDTDLMFIVGNPEMFTHILTSFINQQELIFTKKCVGSIEHFEIYISGDASSYIDVSVYPQHSLESKAVFNTDIRLPYDNKLHCFSLAFTGLSPAHINYLLHGRIQFTGEQFQKPSLFWLLSLRTTRSERMQSVSEEMKDNFTSSLDSLITQALSNKTPKQLCHDIMHALNKFTGTPYLATAWQLLTRIKFILPLEDSKSICLLPYIETLFTCVCTNKIDLAIDHLNKKAATEKPNPQFVLYTIICWEILQHHANPIFSENAGAYICRYDESSTYNLSQLINIIKAKQYPNQHMQNSILEIISMYTELPLDMPKTSNPQTKSRRRKPPSNVLNALSKQGMYAANNIDHVATTTPSITPDISSGTSTFGYNGSVAS